MPSNGEPPPGWMFLTMRVPPSVPSLAHSSAPLTPSSAMKNSRRPTEMSSRMAAWKELISFTSTVPAVVPSDFHSAVAVRKYKHPLVDGQLARSDGAHELGARGGTVGLYRPPQAPK